MITTYRNKRNENKFIDVKHTKDHHYLWRQRMVWGNVINHVATPKGGFRRMNKKAINEVLEDYLEVFE